MRVRILMLVLCLSLVQVINVWAVSPKVYDEAGLLSEEERETIEQSANELSENISLDIVIVTTNDTQGKTSKNYADDFYDDNGFGYGENADGLLLLINMQDREVYISTTGLAIHYFTDDRIDAILDNIYPKLSESQYASSMLQFLIEVSNYVDEGIPTSSTSMESSNKSSYSSDEGVNVTQGEDNTPHNIKRFFIAIGIAGAVVGIMALSNRGLKKTNARTYLKDNTFRITDRMDLLVDTDLTYSVVQQKSDSGGTSTNSSSTHRSSSGRTHGGGGRKF